MGLRERITLISFYVIKKFKWKYYTNIYKKMYV